MAKCTRIISGGQHCIIVKNFFAGVVDEVYAIADGEWVEKKGATPVGLPMEELEVQMQALKEE